MKKLLFILSLIACGFMGSAQTLNPFPTTDSLRKFINKWIRNSAVDAFTNLRLNTALIGMSRFVDSADGGRSVDTIYRTPGVDSIYFKISGITYAIKDSTGGSGISGLTLGRVVIPASATTVTDDAGLLYDSTVNELTTDSTSAVQHRASYMTLNKIQTVDSIRLNANSHGAGANASPIIDSSYANRFGRFMEKPVANYSVSGTGIVTAIALCHRYTPLLHNDLTFFEIGFNDIRRNDIFGGTGIKTIRKVVNGHKSGIANHFLKSFVAAGSGSVTRYNVGGSWAAPWDARNEGGKTGTAAYTGGLNDSAVYVSPSPDSTVVIGMIGGDAEGSTYSVYVDNVLTATGTTAGQYDGINDGFSGNTRAPLCVIITGLTYAIHTIKVVKTSGSSLLILDYFGHLRDAVTAPPFVLMHIPYMDATGYATAPNGSSVVKTDTMNNKLDSLVAAFPSSYQEKIFIVQTENYYDTLTGLDPADHIHANNTGHGQFANAIIAAISSTPIPDWTLFAANEKLYFKTPDGNTKVQRGEGVADYVAKFIDNDIISPSQIRDDGTNVGIGQAPATYKLGVTGTLRVTADAAFATSSGNVGIGTASPAFKLDVNGSTNITGPLNISGGSSTLRVLPRNGIGPAFEIYGASGAYNFYMTSAVDFMKFSADGKIGINKTPVWGLDIVRSVAIEKDSTPISPTTDGMYVLLQDTTSTADSNRIKRILPSSISGTASNGVTKSGNDFQLGDSLTHNTTIDTRAHSLTLSGTKASGGLLTVTNSGTGKGIVANSGADNAIEGIATGGTGVTGSSTGGVGGFFQSNTNVAGVFYGLPGTGNAETTVLEVRSSPTVSIANGTAARTDWYNGTVRSHRFVSKLTSVTGGSETSQFILRGLNTGTESDKLIINGNGQTQLPAYGSGTFTGTPAYTLQVDASGNLIEGGAPSIRSASSGDGDFSIASNIGLQRLIDITANRAVTMPTPTDGKVLIVWNSNSAGFTWNITGSVVNAAGGAITSFTNDTVYQLVGTGSEWLRIN